MANALNRNLNWLSRHENILLSLLAVCVGLLSGSVAILFRHLIAFVQNLSFFGAVSTAHPVDVTQHTLGLWVILIPGLGGLLVGILTKTCAYDVRGHGVPEVMEAAVAKGGKMLGRVIPFKAIATALSLGTGGSTGREGPTVQIGAATGSWIAQRLNLRPELTKVLLACGAAGGIAASFNTPIGGVLFALELILLEFKTRSFIPLVISAVFATVVSRTFLGDSPTFTVPEYSLLSNLELIAYLFLGVSAGFLAILYIKISEDIENRFESMPVPFVLKPMFGGLIVGAIGYFVPELFSGGYETINRILFSNVSIFFCLLFVFGKMLASAITLGSGGSGGVFAPSLFIGAALGGFVGGLMNLILPFETASPGAYALVGMAAFFSGVSRATLTAIIILFEMTLNYNIIIPLMFACVVADAIAWSFFSDSIYTARLRRRGVRVLQDLGPDILGMHLVKEVMSENVITARDSCSVREVWQLITETGHQGIPILSESEELVGIVTASDVRTALLDDRLDEPASTYMTKELVTALPTETLHDLHDKVSARRIGHVPVVSVENDKKLVGIITRSDLMKVGS